MLRASHLSGQPVVDIDAAETLGRIDEVIVDPEARRVAAFVISCGAALTRHRVKTLLPPSAVHAIGPDAVTVRGGAGSAEDPARLQHLPRISDLVGRKVVSRSGRLLGIVCDVLISGPDGAIVGYALTDSNALGRFFGGRTAARRTYLRADVDLRAGRDLMVASDDALADFPEERPEPARPEAVSQPEALPPAPEGGTSRRDRSLSSSAPAIW